MQHVRREHDAKANMAKVVFHLTGLSGFATPSGAFAAFSAMVVKMICLIGPAFCRACVLLVIIAQRQKKPKSEKQRCATAWTHQIA